MSIAPAPHDSLPRFGVGLAVLVFVAFLLLGIVYTTPLVTHIQDGLPFSAVPPEGRETSWEAEGDYLQFYYYLWLVRDRLLEGASFLRDPYQFAVNGSRPNLPNIFLPLALLFVPLSAIDPRIAYNALVLLSFPFAGLAMALLVHRYGVGRSDAIVAGAVLACLPYRVAALLGGHPAGFAYFFVPLALWGLEGALAGSVAGGAWCAIALVSIAIMEPHFLYFAGLGLPLYLFARVGLTGWAPAALRIGAPAWVAALAVAQAPAWGALAALETQGFRAPLAERVALGALVALGAVALWQCGAGWLRAAGVAPDARAAARRSLLGCLPWLATAASPAVGTTATLVALGLPVVIHAAWLRPAWPVARKLVFPLGLAGLGAGAGIGFLLVLHRLLLTRSVSGAGRSLHEVLLFSPTPADLLVRANPFSARAVFIGALPLILALVGVVALSRRTPTPRRRILWVFAPLLGLGVALSLGPRLPGVPLFEAAFHLVPFWNFVRQPAKFQIVVGIALGTLAAIGTATLAARLSRRWWRTALPLAVALAIAVELHPWRPTGVSLLPTAGESYDLIRQLGPRALYVPLWPGDSSFSGLYLYATTLTRVAMLNGYSAWLDRAYLTEVYAPLQTVNVGSVGETEHAGLRRFGVRQVILDRDAFPIKVSAFGPAFTLANLRASPFLELVRPPGDERRLWVFKVREQRGTAAAVAPRSPLGIYWEAESLPRDTGRITDDPDASNGRAVIGRAERDASGFLTFGPYRLLPAGPFRAVFRLRGAQSTVALEVTTSGGRRLAGMREVRLASGAFEEFAVPFTLETPATVEYRTKWDGNGWLAVDAIAVTFADVPDPAPTIEVELLAHELTERPDPAASGGLAGYADPARAPRDQVWVGPLRRYPEGQYRLWVRLKVDEPVTGVLAWCGAQAASLGPLHGGRDLLGSEVPEASRYVELAVPFALPRPTVLEFPCRYYGRAGVWFDRLRIEGPRPSAGGRQPS